MNITEFAAYAGVSKAAVSRYFNNGYLSADKRAAIEKAVAMAKEQGVHGKETTPFLLATIKDITGGDSLDSNIQLVFNNARLAAQTAAELCKL